MSKSKRMIDIALVIILILIPIVFFWNIISSSIMLYRGDGAGYLATKEFIKSSLFQGQLPLLNRYNALGTPFVADIQNAIFYPFNILVLIFPVNVGFELYFALHLSLAAIGLYFYLKNITENRSISFSGALVIMFSNILVIRFNHINILTTVAWVPFILFITDKLLKKGKVKYAIYLGILMAFQFLSGFPQVALYSDIFVFCYYIFSCFHNKIQFKNIIKTSIIFIGTYFGVIAIQLVPLAQLTIFSNRGEISYGVFTSYSQSWRMILQMIFPAIWGIGSSNLKIPVEFPTDIYIGIIPLTLCIYGVRYHFKDFRVRLYLFAIATIYALACCGELSFIGKILYKIPIINSFRVPCRMIPFVVINGLILAFYSVFLLLRDKDYIRYLKLCLIILLTSGAFVLLIHFASTPIFNIFKEEYVSYYLDISLYLPAILLMLINIILVYVLFVYPRTVLKYNFGKLFCILMGIVTILDVYALNKDKWSDGYRIQELMNNPTEEIFYSDIGNTLEELPDKDLYRSVVDFKNLSDYGLLPADITGSNNIFHKYMSLQSYITFENPYYNNFCKVTDSKYLNSNLLLSDTNPSIISSLSAKYIVRSNNDPLYYKKVVSENTIYSDQSLVELNCDINSLLSHVVPIKVERNTTYKINMDMDIDALPKLLVADLYGGSGAYDSNEQEISLLPYLSTGNNQISFYLNSGDVEIPEDAVIRILLNGNTKALINSIKVSTISFENTDLFKALYSNDLYTIYENPLAKPILYVPSQVTCVEDAGKTVNNNMIDSDLAENVLTEDTENYNLSEGNSAISDITVENNKVKGTISSDTDTFVIMTQAWYPGWKAYIDGKRIDIKLVNNVVQGIEVPQGNHQIEFRFTSPSMILGGIISLCTWIIIIFILILERRNSKNNKWLYTIQNKR